MSGVGLPIKVVQVISIAVPIDLFTQNEVCMQVSACTHHPKLPSLLIEPKPIAVCVAPIFKRDSCSFERTRHEVGCQVSISFQSWQGNDSLDRQLLYMFLVVGLKISARLKTKHIRHFVDSTRSSVEPDANHPPVFSDAP